MKRKAREQLPNRAAGSFPSYLYKSLVELEGPWGEPPERGSELIEQCHALHKKPLLILSDEEAALCLQQGIGITWLRTLVILRLRQDPLRTTNEGNLLENALRLPVEAWSGLASDLREIAEAIVPTLPETPETLPLILAFKRFAATLR